MKVKVIKAKRQKKRIHHMLQCHGTSADKKAYKSLTSNILGLTRKLQSADHRLANAKHEIERLQSELAEEKRLRLFGDVVHSCSMGVGDGTGNLVVHGDHASIKQAQRIVLAAEDNRVAAHKLGEFVRAAGFYMPDECKEFLTRVERELVKMAGNC